MAGTTTTTTNVKLKLLVDKKAQRVVFAEAGKDFVDFLFTLFRLPLATVVRLLLSLDSSMVNSLSTLYRSIETLDKSFLGPGTPTSSILHPAPAPTPTTPTAAVRPLFPYDLFSSPEKTYYMCGNFHQKITEVFGTKCLQCSLLMTKELKVAPSNTK